MANFEIINHGWDNSQYFQGCGTSYSDFDNVVTGAGYTAKDAYEDATEQIYMSFNNADKLKLPKRPKGINAKNHVPAKADEDCYWYVSIRFNL